MTIETAADLAVFFSADGAGSLALYTPPSGGGATPCVIIVGGRVEFPEFSAAARTNGVVISVRASEVAAPAAGGVFETDSRSYTIVGDPVTEEPDRQVWLCQTA